MNLKFIGHSILGIKKFLTPYKWETIWRHKCIGNYTYKGVPIQEGNFVAVVQYDRYKDTYRSFMTDGNRTSDVDINFLVGSSPELKEVLKRNGIKI